MKPTRAQAKSLLESVRLIEAKLNAVAFKRDRLLQSLRSGADIEPLLIRSTELQNASDNLKHRVDVTADIIRGIDRAHRAEHGNRLCPQIGFCPEKERSAQKMGTGPRVRLVK